MDGRPRSSALASTVQDMTYTLRSTNRDGTKNETEITAEQALDLGAGKPIAYFPRDERVLVDDDGTITHRASAIPQMRDEAA